MKLKLFLFLFALNGLIFAQQGDLQNRFMLAQNYEQLGQFSKAKSIYEELYKNQPANFAFFQALNKCYVQLKEYNNSQFLIEQKLATDKGNVSILGMLGTTLYLNGEEKKAFQLWDDFLADKKD
ncbi:MAG: hypothetical protein Q8K40_09435, partial [Ignavibacteria bacterium]|nr:hypothetical protein [Ignavibacteria bacterium]